MSELPSLAKLSLREEPTEAMRGGRKEYMQGAQFDAARAYKLTASLLPKWCGVAKQPETRRNIIKNLLKTMACTGWSSTTSTVRPSIMACSTSRWPCACRR